MLLKYWGNDLLVVKNKSTLNFNIVYFIVESKRSWETRLALLEKNSETH